MELSRDDVAKVAQLGRLKLSPAEIDRMQADLTSIMKYVEQLNEVPTDGVEPLAHALPTQNVFREDELGQSLPVDEALANAPKRAGDFFAVPKILGQ